MPDEAFAELAWSPPPGVIVERWRADLPALFRTCALSVSQAGYNTVMDLLRARARAVLVPFAAGGESEQTFARQGARRAWTGGAVDAATLSPKILADAIDAGIDAAPALRRNRLYGRRNNGEVRRRPLRDAGGRHRDGMANWDDLARELDAWHRERDVARTFWWRDDDAARVTPALMRLLALSDAAETPVALAVIPRDAEDGLREHLASPAAACERAAAWLEPRQPRSRRRGRRSSGRTGRCR